MCRIETKLEPLVALTIIPNLEAPLVVFSGILDLSRYNPSVLVKNKDQAV